MRREIAGGYSHVHADDGLEWAHVTDTVCFKGQPPGRESDPVQMPSHYTQLPVECIDVTEHFGFCLGNAIKYIWRADHKGKPVEDLEKAAWYIRREIERRKRSEDAG